MFARLGTFKARAIRKLLMASLCIAVAMTWTMFNPAVVEADDNDGWCSEDCETLCDGVGSHCGWLVHTEGGCDFGCA